MSNILNILEYNQRKLLNVSSMDGLIISSYSKKCFVEGSWDEITLNTRGHVFDLKGNIVSPAFHKFFNVNEIEETKTNAIVSRINNGENYVVFDKVNGHFAKVFYHEGNFINTTKCSFSSEMVLNDKEIFQKNLTFEKIRDFEYEGKTFLNFTFMFEILSDKDQHCMHEVYEARYGKNVPVLIGIMDNSTCELIDPVKVYYWAKSMRMLVAEMESVEIHNKDQLVRLFDHVFHEGYVIYFPESNFIVKLKTIFYLKERYKSLLFRKNRIKNIFMKNLFDINTAFEFIPEEFYFMYKNLLFKFLTFIKCKENKAWNYINNLSFCNRINVYEMEYSDAKNYLSLNAPDELKRDIFRVFDGKYISINYSSPFEPCDILYMKDLLGKRVNVPKYLINDFIKSYDFSNIPLGVLNRY